MLYNRTNVTSGWTLVSGTTYSRTLAASEVTVHKVKAPSPYQRLTPNAGLTAGSYHQIGTTLYVNIGQNPNGVEVIYAWGRTEGIILEDCWSHHNIHNPAAPWREGHGFAFDDFTSRSIIRRCSSYENEGVGYSINHGEYNLIESSTAIRNHRRAVMVVAGRGNHVRNLTAIDNYATDETAYSDVDFSAMAVDGSVSNSIIVGRAPHGISNTTGVTNSLTLTNNSIYGHTNRTQNNVETGAVVGNPLLDQFGVPLAGSPCRETGAVRLGLLDRRGSRFSQTAPTIGAYETKQSKAVLVAY